MSSDMDDHKVFPRGRHRNKTYQQVFEKDKAFCEMILNGEKSHFIPEDFREYLMKRTIKISLPRCVIKERSAPHFVKALTPETTQILLNILKDVNIDINKVHPTSKRIRSNGFLGVFYHFFIKKCVFNITNIDASCKYIDNYASVFPFLVSNELKHCKNAEILDIFRDDSLHREMQSFLNLHFDDVDLQPIVDSFFANIISFRSKNFTEFDLFETTKNMNLKGFSMLDDENNNTVQNGNSFSKFKRNGEPCEYLKNFPRVNNSGAGRYKDMYDVVADVYNYFQKPFNVPSFKYDQKYLTKLPEINFYELFSLLNPEFFRSERAEYIYRLKKYIFFFINASRSHTNKPVFFLDDVLFECLQSWTILKRSRRDVFDLKFELAMATLVYRRKQPSENAAYDIDDENLKNVKKYITSFPNIERARIDFAVDTPILDTMALISTPETCVDVCVRHKTRGQISDFFELIFHAAFSPNNIKRLVIYNAHNGEESVIKMPRNKEELINFVRTYNKYDFSEKLPPTKFITWGHEKYYASM